MTKNEFILMLQEKLEIEQILDGKTILNNLEEWDSLAAMTLIALVYEEFSIKLTVEDINSLTTVDSIIDKIGVTKFN